MLLFFAALSKRNMENPGKCIKNSMSTRVKWANIPNSCNINKIEIDPFLNSDILWFRWSI